MLSVGNKLCGGGPSLPTGKGFPSYLRLDSTGNQLDDDLSPMKQQDTKGMFSSMFGHLGSVPMDQFKKSMDPHHQMNFSQFQTRFAPPLNFSDPMQNWNRPIRQGFFPGSPRPPCLMSKTIPADFNFMGQHIGHKNMSAPYNSYYCDPYTHTMFPVPPPSGGALYGCPPVPFRYTGPGYHPGQFTGFCASAPANFAKSQGPRYGCVQQGMHQKHPRKSCGRSTPRHKNRSCKSTDFKDTREISPEKCVKSDISEQLGSMNISACDSVAKTAPESVQKCQLHKKTKTEDNQQVLMSKNCEKITVISPVAKTPTQEALALTETLTHVQDSDKVITDKPDQTETAVSDLDLINDLFAPSCFEIEAAITPGKSVTEIKAPSNCMKVKTNCASVVSDNSSIAPVHSTASKVPVGLLLPSKKRKKSRPSAKRRIELREKRESSDQGPSGRGSSTKSKDDFKSCKKNGALFEDISFEVDFHEPEVESKSRISGVCKITPTSDSENKPTSFSFVVTVSDSETDTGSDWDDDSDDDVTNVLMNDLDDPLLNPFQFHFCILSAPPPSSEVSSATAEKAVNSDECDTVDGATSSDFDESFPGCSQESRREVQEQLRRFNSLWSITGDVTFTDDEDKKVHFARDDALVAVHVAEDWARRGPWETYARDRCRFNDRIHKFEEASKHVFNQAHRQKMYNKYYSDNVDDSECC
eukprot:GHVU01062768.1.p1 GENE.GHVU01062768.1~~GHVU01062768.1.p1  ORF type:complete len:698 (+),score=62.05 GHVU01062768.1:1129-3222(+)